MYQKQLLLILFTFAGGFVLAQQKDTASFTELDEVVVTATKTERKLSNVAVPVKVISGKTIQQSGSLRLNNILQEQPGLYITNSFGNGVQVQGLSPDYVLILVDGEPLVGRNGGVLDLNRITVNNIKKIEIVKGPSSSLYGSEAMGGVINIITQNASNSALDASLRYAKYSSIDANLSGSFKHKGFSFSAFGNRNSSDGFSNSNATVGKTVNPFYNYTGQVKIQQEFSANLKAGLGFRYFYEKQNDLYSTGSDIAYGNPDIKEYNLAPFVSYKVNANLRTTIRTYFSQFQSEAKDYLKSNNSLYYDDFFQQRFSRVESQTDLNIGSSNNLSAGGGYTWERLNTNRYSGIRTNHIAYVFLQDEHRFSGKLTAIAGIRYDDNAAYASRLSPKLALRYKADSKLALTASYGAGFKAPDFRQLYLNFTNNAAGGYTVYGANEITFAQLEQQKTAGILADISAFGYQLQLLKPEYSTGLNVGATYQFSRKLGIKLNVFRNDISNLIVTRIIATKTTGAPVYSYFNVNSAFTEGAESEVTYHFTKNLRAEAGYQFMITADKEVLRQIKAGQLYGKKQGSLVSEEVKRNEYGGLTDRSKHMANLKFFYEKSNWFATARAVYRGRWGVADKDGNLILNRDDEYAKAMLQLNLSAGIHFKNGLGIKAGVDNLLNYQDKVYQANQPGITCYATVSYALNNPNK
ncbi:TonB-dependent receptor [Sediminibacterium roseum]|uniref:TonB-dependent receptor n=1 Tax=Sediminibacterium roseum TaxID=1978412 RepID=A0ABW9ZS99_9BACT|nr:TonB-dependent receptor [Sediminibacterium roseum]NCI48943.1 TonB-dependent receptor [Sediminibacterium roseum]